MKDGEYAGVRPDDAQRAVLGNARHSESEPSVGAEMKSLSAFSSDQTFMRALLRPILNGMAI